MKSVLLPLLLLATPALAATGSISLVDVNHVEYFFNDNITFSTTSSASGAASEASFTQSVSASTVSGGMAMSDLGDGFDGYNSLSVNDTTYYNNGASTLECGDRQIVFAAQVIGNLEVSRKAFVPTDAGFARWMNVITNTGATTETVVVRIDNNLGSDSNTLLKASSSGDDLVDLTDNWAVSMQAFSDPPTAGDGGSDIRLAHVWQNDFGTVKAETTTFATGDDNPVWEYTFDLPAGETAILLSYASGAATWADAQTAAEALVDLTAPATSCITTEEWDAVLNFGVDCADAADDCNEATFDVMSGTCVKTATNEGGSCDDGSDCTVDDMCTLGSCDGDPAPEEVGTEEDANCDASVECYADADGDGFRTDETVTSDDIDCSDAGEATAATASGDCDDADADASPEGTEIPDDGIDQDCSGADAVAEKTGCSCDTTGAPQGSILAMLMGATVLLRRKARQA